MIVNRPHAPRQQNGNTNAVRSLSRRRVSVIAGVFIIAFVVIAARTFYLQFVKAPTLGDWADKQQQNTQILRNVRGDILDRNGQELAVGDERLTFYATPHLVKDVGVTVDKIGDVLNFKPKQRAELITRLQSTESGFEYVARKVPRRLGEQIIDARIDGIGWFEEEQRIYPLGPVASQVIGYAGTDNVGLSGIESLYEKSLAGRPGRQVIVRDPTGTPVDILEIQREIDGRSVTLTIDSTVQMYAESVLKQTVKQFSAKGATAIVMNPRNGEILALANLPLVDANKFGNAPLDWQRNRAITDVYEPGSTFKAVTVSAALEEGLVTPDKSFFLQPTIRVADRTIENSHSRPAQTMDVRRILVESDNVGTVTIGLRLGRDKLDEWIRKFGFGESTGIDFPGEVNGLVLDPEDWSGSTIGNVPIGQGIGVTAMQLINAYATIANDGVMVQPHLLKGVQGEPAVKYDSRRVISERTARQMRNMLGQVVTDDRGTGKLAQIPGYRVGGKTGTANKAEKGVYVKGRYVSSFVGFVPANNPQLVTLVVVDEPDVPWGGTVAGPAFEKITQFALNYLAIPPDGQM